MLKKFKVSKLDEESSTVWATQREIAKLFDVSINWIARQLKNETLNYSVCSLQEHTGSDGNVYKVKHYSLKLILEIG